MSDLWLDFALASTHHVLVFSLFVILTMEIVYAKPGMDAGTLRRLGGIDAGYGLISMLVLVVGFSRAIWGLKGWEYYSGNPIFWVKIALFIVVGLLSLKPTIAYLSWNKRLREDAAYLPPDAEVRANRKWLHMEAGVLFLIPIVAAALARGVAD